MANEDLLIRQMPHSLEGEQAVLGSMLIDEGCVKDVMDKLVPSDFYLRQNREIFETIYTMFAYARPIDGITVCEEMRKAGTYDENTTRSYLAQLMEITPTSANVMEYVAIVHDKALLRGVAQAAGEITALVQEGVGEAGDILEAAEQKIYAVRRGQSAQEMVPLRMVLPDVLDRLSEMSENESHLPGLSTGLSAVDRKITGLNKSDLILLAGDFVDGRVAVRGGDLRPLEELSAPLGVFGVPGNHEYYSGYEEWMLFLSGLGIDMLENSHRILAGGKLALGGVTDPAAARFGQETPDLRKTFDGAPPGAVKLLLAHQPKPAAEAAKSGVALQVSGHTHGGMIVGIDRLVARFNAGFVAGSYRVGDLRLYVSRGSGIWNGFPIRLGVPSEITLLRLKRQE